MHDEEIFDVVDDNDQVVGQATRTEVHRQSLKHRSAHILVFKPSGHLYLQRRAFWKECSPGQWDSSASGHLNSGETYALGAARELTEELGIRGQHLEPLFKLAADPATGNEFVAAFKTVTNEDLSPDPHEIIAGRWCTPAEVAAWIQREPGTFTGTFHLIWSKLNIN